MKLPPVSNHNVAMVPQIRVQRSAFDLSHAHKTTFDAGKLIPVFAEEVIPGDTWSVDAQTFARLATPIYPIMDNMKMDIHFFFCPIRLVWDNFVKMMGERIDPADNIDFQTPIVTVNAGSGVGFAAYSMYDYLGIPTEIDDLSVVNLVPRCYNLIYNEWYRDQTMQDSLVVDTDDGPDTISDYVIRNRCKRGDYFTTALDEPQKGAGITLPMGGSAPVTGIGKRPAEAFDLTNRTALETDGTGTVTYADAVEIGDSAVNNLFYAEEDPNNAGYPNIRVDLSAATGIPLNTVREAFATQQLLEIDARSGTRYPEVLMGQYGVNDPSMAILQRPQFLGGGQADLIITPIAQTSPTAASNAMGDLAGFGTVQPRGGFTASFSEHGYIIGIVSTRAELTYWQGIPRMYSRRDRYDFYMPVFAHLGEQAILKQEIYATENATTNAEVFGYQERWGEYRRAQSKVTGLFRPNHAQTLAAWHLAQDFGSMPELNSTFITETPPMARVIAVNTEPHFIFDSFFRVRVVRPMPVFSVPGLERL